MAQINWLVTTFQTLSVLMMASTLGLVPVFLDILAHPQPNSPTCRMIFRGRARVFFFLGAKWILTTIVDTQICLFYGSDSAACGGVANSVCTDTGVNSRTCACAVGYTGVGTVASIADSDTTAGGFAGTCTGNFFFFKTPNFLF